MLPLSVQSRTTSRALACATAVGTSRQARTAGTARTLRMNGAGTTTPRTGERTKLSILHFPGSGVAQGGDHRLGPRLVRVGAHVLAPGGAQACARVGVVVEAPDRG